MALGDAARPDEPPRFLSSLRGLLASLVGLAATRLQLAGIELSEEKQRLLGALALLLGAMLFAALGLLVLSFLVVAWFWDSQRWAALIGLTLVYALLAAALAWKLKRELASHPPLFQATAEELQKDRDLLAAVLGEPGRREGGP